MSDPTHPNMKIGAGKPDSIYGLSDEVVVCIGFSVFLECHACYSLEFRTEMTLGGKSQVVRNFQKCVFRISQQILCELDFLIVDESFHRHMLTFHEERRQIIRIDTYSICDLRNSDLSVQVGENIIFAVRNVYIFHRVLHGILIMKPDKFSILTLCFFVDPDRGHAVSTLIKLANCYIA